MGIYVEPQNKIWLAREFQVWPRYHGIDLSDDHIGIEMKSRCRRYSPNFTIHNYQVERFSSSKENFWAFLLYDVSLRGNGWSIRDREAWLVPWEFANTLPVSVTPKEKYRYVHGTQFPYELVEVKRPGGILHVPKDSVLEERLTEREARIYHLAR